MTDARSVLSECRFVLLDFDGPVCGVFSGYPASDIAGSMVQLLRSLGVSLPVSLMKETDPMEVLRWTAVNSVENVGAVDKMLVESEEVAVKSAALTPYADRVVRNLFTSGRKIAITSNNSASAIEWYLRKVDLSGYVEFVLGRPFAEPHRMKPNPEMVNDAIRRFGANVRDVVLIGDSVSDVEASRSAGIRSIGYANRPGRRSELESVGVSAVVDTMESLL